MRLRSGRISPGNTEMSPDQRFPFKFPAAALPQAGPDYHLVHTATPNISPIEQPRGFPRQSVRFLASFANKVSNSDNVFIPASTYTPDPLSTIFTQGRLHCSQHRKIPPNRFNPCSWLTCSTSFFINRHAGFSSKSQGLHGRGVNACMPLQIAPKP